MKANIPEFHVGNLKNSHSPEITTEDGVTVYIAPEGYDNEYDLSPIFLLSDDDILALEDGEPVTATNKNGDEELQVQVSENCDKCTATEDEVDELVSVWDYTLCPDCSEKARSYLSDWF